MCMETIQPNQGVVETISLSCYTPHPLLCSLPIFILCVLIDGTLALVVNVPLRVRAPPPFGCG